MKIPSGYKALKGSEHSLPKGDKVLKPTSEKEQATVTLVLRRRPGGPKLKEIKDFSSGLSGNGHANGREQFADAHGADLNEMNLVADFAKSHGMKVLESNKARRSVVVSGSVGTMNKAFAVKMTDYSFARGKYRSYAGTVNVPAPIAKVVEAVIGLHERVCLHKPRTIRQSGNRATGDRV